MKLSQVIKKEEIPFDELEKVGISKSAFLALPKQVVDAMMRGQHGPLMTITVTSPSSGQKYNIDAKLRFARLDNGKVALMETPRTMRIKDEFNLPKSDIDELQNRKTIVRVVEKDGEKEKRFLQLDPETNSVMSVPVDEVHIPSDITTSLLTSQMTAIYLGEPVETMNAGRLAVIGIDLNSAFGYRLHEGDLEDWYETKLMAWDKAEPGVKGFWSTSENAWQYEEYQDKLDGVDDREDGRILDSEMEEEEQVSARIHR